MLTARRAERGDVTGIESLIGPDVRTYVKRFGQFSVPHLIEASILSVTVLDVSDHVVGFASILDAPPVGLAKGELAQCNCGEWFKSTFRSEEFGGENTGWMTFFVSAQSMENDVADQLLQTVFSTLPSLEAVLALVPQDTEVFTPVTEMFEQLPFVDELYYGPRVFACPRSFFIPSLNVRVARIEDHDDLVPVFNEQSEALTDIYGEFFLAELIENKDPHSRSLVAEINERAVGLMTITDEVEVDLLRSTFQLEPYDNLYVVEEEPEKEEEPEPEPEPEEENLNEERVQRIFDFLLAKQAEAETTPVEGEPAKEPLPEGLLAKATVTELLGAYVASLGLDEDSGDQELMEPSQAALDTMLKQVPDKVETPEPAKPAPVPAKKGKKGKKGKNGKATPEPEAPKKPVKEAGPLGFNAEMFTKGVFSIFEITETAMVDPLDYLETNTGLGPVPEVVKEEEKKEEVVLVTEQSDNCFAITLFCLDEGFEARSLAFLEPAFAMFPDKEYCIVTLPHTAQEPKLLSHFTQVPAQPNSTLGHVLYLLHRDSITTNEVTLRWLEDADLEEVSILLEGAANERQVLAEMKAAIAAREEAKTQVKERKVPSAEVASAVAFATGTAAFVVECFDQPIGVICLRQREDVEQLRAAFALEEFVDPVELYHDNEYSEETLAEKRKTRCLQAALKYFIINPLFTNKSGYLFREVMRLYQKSIVYYQVEQGQPLQDVTELFVQVRPRSKPEISPKTILLAEAEAGYPVYEDKDMHFGLHMITRRLLSQPKAKLNSRVVVVGASDVALSLLETLLLQSDLNYSSIVLLNPGGIPSRSGSSHFSEWGMRYDQSRLRKLAIESRVRVIPDSLASLDCDKQQVILGDGAILPYDYLVLTPGLQEQTRGVLGVDPEENMGVFSVSSEDGVGSLLTYLTEHDVSQTVVYGNTLQALCTIRGLMDSGVPGSSITWAFPQSMDKQPWCGRETDVARRVEQTLAENKIEIMPNTTLNAAMHDDLGFLRELKLTVVDTNEGQKRRREMSIPVQCLVACNNFDVDANIFTSVADNCLVYDGRMVVDARFRTADKRVFAAGTVAKFSRRYGITLPQERYSSVEIGQRLADFILQEIDPLSESIPEEEGAHTQPPTLGTEPKVKEGKLPGGLHYFEAVTPLLEPVTHPKVLTSRAHFDICRLVFDDYNVLVSVKYVGAEAIPARNLMALVGMPASYLNRILWRYANNKLHNLIDFLRSPTMTALSHESFPELREQLTEDLGEQMEGMQELVSSLTAQIAARSNGERVDPQRVSELIKELLPQEIKTMLQVKTLKFLNEHANHLPGYQVSAEKST